MPAATFWILTSDRWRHVAASHRDQLASRWRARVELCFIGKQSEGEACVGAMVEEWSELRASSELPTRYNDPERILRWLADIAKDEAAHTVAPYVVVAADGESKAVVAGEIQETGSLARLPVMSGAGPGILELEVSETAFLVKPGPELSELCAVLLTSLLCRAVVDRVRIRNLPRDHPAFDIVSGWDRLDARGAREPRVRWWARLLDPATGERVDLHSSKTRWSFRKADRRLAEAFEGDAELECVTRVEQVDGFVQAATGIIQRTYQASLGIGVQDTQVYRAFLREMAEAGALRGYLLRGKGEPLAYVLGDRWGTTFSLWATAFLPEHRSLAPGIVTLRRVMDSLATEGVASFDFGWGEADYKRKLGDRHSEEVDFSLYARRPVPTLWFLVARTSRAVRARADEIMGNLGLRDRFKAVWRKRLARS